MTQPETSAAISARVKRDHAVSIPVFNLRVRATTTFISETTYVVSTMMLSFVMLLPLVGAVPLGTDPKHAKKSHTHKHHHGASHHKHHLLRAEEGSGKEAAMPEVEEKAHVAQAPPPLGTWPNCTSCPDDPTCTNEVERFRDDMLEQCVAFCTGDEVPMVLGSDQPGNKTCQSCPTGKYANHETHECMAFCPAGEAPNEKNACAVCKQPFPYADHVNHKCVAKCPPGKVPDAMRGNDCTTCNNSAFPFADHERHACVKQCGPGKIGDVTLKECRACDAGKYADHKNLVCGTTCPADHPYMDGLDCVMTCGEGKVPDPNLNGGADEFVCSYCPAGKFADHALHRCETSCSPGYSPDPEGTLATKYKNDCKRCPAGKFADHVNKKCVVTCPTGTVAKAGARDCE